MKTNRNTPLLPGAAWIVVFAVPLFSQTIPAFPGAEGFGKWAQGGRGGRVIYVTNLNDSGEGSLRAACEASGARTVVFRVSGTIALKSTISIIHPFITIAGHTAPQRGICLRSSGVRGIDLMVVSTHDVVIRHVRFRRGPSIGGMECTGDNLSILGGSTCMVDHCSFSWGTDELASSWPANDITFQWCIFSEGLYRSTHSQDCGNPDGVQAPQAFGPLFGDKTKNLSVYANLFANNVGRNPSVQFTETGLFEVVNNFIYNACYAVPIAKRSNGNALNNFIKWGPNSCGNNRNNILMKDSVKVYVSGNITPFRTSSTQDEWLATSEFMKQTPARTHFKAKVRFDTPLSATMTAIQACDSVTQKAGANRAAKSDGTSQWSRDEVDERAVEDAQSGTDTKGTSGRQLDHPDDVGGWPHLASGTPYADADHDGMADSWEKSHGLNPAEADHNGHDLHANYTNLEIYLQYLAEDISSQPEPPMVTFTRPAETVVTEPADLGVAVEATAPGGSIDSVTLFINGTFVRQENTAPYKWGTANTTEADSALLGLSAGTYTLQAVATDTRGATASDTLTVTVKTGAVGVNNSSKALLSLPVPQKHTVQVFDLRGQRVVQPGTFAVRGGEYHVIGSMVRGVAVVRHHGSLRHAKIAVIDGKD